MGDSIFTYNHFQDGPYLRPSPFSAVRRKAGFLFLLFLLPACVSRKSCSLRVSEAHSLQASYCLKNQKGVELFYQDEANDLKARIGALEAELGAKDKVLRKFNLVGPDGKLRTK